MTPHRLPWVRLLCTLLAWVGPVAHAETGDTVRLRVTGPAVPYAAAEYVCEAREDAAVVSVTKTFAADFGHHATVGLLPTDGLDPLLAQLERLGLGALPSIERRGHRVRYALTVVRGGRAQTLTFDDPERGADPRYRQIVQAVLALVAANTDPIPFEDALLLPSEYGQLRIATQPPGTVRIDGVAVPGQTPHKGLRVEAGDHRVEITPVGGGPRYEYDVKIPVGRTTSLIVDLK